MNIITIMILILINIIIRIIEDEEEQSQLKLQQGKDVQFVAPHAPQALAQSRRSSRGTESNAISALTILEEVETDGQQVQVAAAAAAKLEPPTACAVAESEEGPLLASTSSDRLDLGTAFAASARAG